LTPATTVETPWARGKLASGSRDHAAPRLLFGNMYEDTEIERQAFAPGGHIFCIAAAGTTAVRLAEEHEVVACDINPVQLGYAERRANGGPAERGDAERGMAFARRLMPLAGWREGVVREFLALCDPAEQMDFWRIRMDTWRFRIGFDLLLSRAVLRHVYAPEFLAFLPPNFGAVVRGRLERAFAHHPNASSPYVATLLLGDALGSPIAKSGSKSSAVKFVLGDAASVLETCEPHTFTGFTLSNILDGAPASYRERLSRAVQRAAMPGAVVVRRSFAEPSADLGKNYAIEDRTMLWGVVEVGEAETF
jgi:hypothetical protein